MNINMLVEIANTIIAGNIGAFSVDVRTVRYYETYGVLKKPPRKGRENDYDVSHLKRLLAIKAMQAKGISLAFAAKEITGDDVVDSILKKSGIDPKVIDAFVAMEVKQEDPRKSEGEERKMEPNETEVEKEEFSDPVQGDKVLPVTVENQIAYDTIKDRLFVGSRFAFVRSPKDELSKSLYAKLYGQLAEPKALERAVVPVPDSGLDLVGCRVLGRKVDKSQVGILVTDKDCYKEGDDVARIFVFDPESKNKDVELRVSLSGTHLDALKVSIDDNGCGLARFPTLVAGSYEVTMDRASCSFEASRYELDPLSVSVSACRRAPEGIEVDLTAERFGRPFVGKAKISLVEYGRPIGDQEANFVDGEAKTKWDKVGEGDLSIQLVPADDKSLIASTPIQGSKKAERELTVVSKMGRVLSASLLASDGSESARGIHVVEESVTNTPVSLESAFCQGGNAKLKFSANATNVMVAVADPSSGNVDVIDIGDVKKGSEKKVKVNFPFAVLSVGAFIDGKTPWEGNSAVIRPSEAKCKIKIGNKSYAPGEEVEIGISSGMASSVFLKVSDNRMRVSREPVVAIASNFKTWLSKELLGLLTGKAWTSKAYPCPVCGMINCSAEAGRQAQRLNAVYTASFGMTGMTGPVGASGSGGFSGFSGVGGSPGYSGYSGESGWSGVSGASGATRWRSKKSKSRVVSRGVVSNDQWSSQDDTAYFVANAGSKSSSYEVTSLAPGGGDINYQLGMSDANMSAVAATMFAPERGPTKAGGGSPQYGESKLYSPLPTPRNWILAAEDAIESRKSDIDVVFCELVRIPKSGGSIKIKLPDRIARYDVKAFFVSGDDWSECEEQVLVTKPAYIEPLIPQVATKGDRCVAIVVNGAEHKDDVLITVNGKLSSFEGGIKGKNLVLTWDAIPGLHEVTVKGVDKVARIVEEAGEEIVLCQETRILVGGRRCEVGPDASALYVLPGMKEELKAVIQVTTNFEHCCCEQTAAKLVSAVLGADIGNDGEKEQAYKAISNGLARLRLLYDGSKHLFTYYPGAGSYHNEWASETTARRLARVGVKDVPQEIARDLAEIRKMANDVLDSCKKSTSLMSHMETCFSEGRFGSASTDDARKSATVLSKGSNASSVAIAEAAYAACCLLRSGRIDDGIEVANVVAKAMSPAMGGGMRGTNELLAYLMMMLSLSDMGVVPATGEGKVIVDGEEMTVKEAVKKGNVTSVLAVEGSAVAVRINRVQKLRLDEVNPALPVEVKLIGTDRLHGWSLKSGTMAKLIIKTSYKAGDVVVVRLPKSLSRMLGGGKQKKFQVDFQGRNEVEIDLVVHEKAKDQKLAMAVRNMYDSGRIGSAGLIGVNVEE
jgi:DNA-binding transcriptional MerR regulator